MCFEIKVHVEIYVSINDSILELENSRMGSQINMEIGRNLLKVCMWVLIIGFGCNFVMQKICYAFYIKAKQMEHLNFKPQVIQVNEKLTGYGYQIEQNSDKVILFFGGSNYIAYNSVGKFGGYYECPFISVDYYGTQQSKGKMNLKSMQQSAEDLYDWAVEHYPNKKIVIMGHSYGTGMAAYLASVRKCDALFLLSGYRNLADLYNRIIPIFWGPLKIFISNDIKVEVYANKVQCKTYIIGSTADKTLSSTLQKKVAKCFNGAELKIFDKVSHENYLIEDEVIQYIRGILE